MDSRADDAQKPVDLDELERLARAATPGPWKHDTDRDHDGIGWSYVRIPDDGARPRMDARHNDAAFIAAANPQAVLALIARLRALSGVVSETYCVSCDHPACGALFEVAFQPRSDVTLYCPKHARK